MSEVGMAVQKSIQTRVVEMYLIIPTTLICILFCTAIPTLPINFIHLFFYACYYSSLFFIVTLGKRMH